MKKIKFFLLLFFLQITFSAHPETFDEWKINFSKYASLEGVSNETISLVVNNLKFLPKVIEYDRYQPEFYEDTFTYVSKRTNKKKIRHW